MKGQFGVYDYLVLFGILAVSVLVGLYHGLKNTFLKRFFPKKISKEDENKGVSDYLVASSTMHPIPVAFSMLATFYSANTLIGMPAEIYTYGTQYFIGLIGESLTPIIAAFCTGPFFAKLKIMSVFEYLKLRFESNLVRLVGMTCYLVRTFISIGVFIYGPATSLTVFTSLNDNIAIGLIGIVATFYTTIGGIKAVIWTDFFQLIIMVVGMFTIIIKGTFDAGGLANVFEINSKGGRISFFDFNPDPFIRQQFWSMFFGFGTFKFMSYCLDQQMLQRFVATKSIKSAQIALLLNVPASLFLVGSCCFCGLILFANYYFCDPLKMKVNPISNPNQLMSFFVLNKIGVIPGFSGLFLASLFSASLSSVSSCLNSMAAILFEDLFKQFKYFRSLNDKQSLNLNRLLVLICGILGTLLAFAIGSLKGNLIQISQSLIGAFNGPIIGLFVLGCFFKFTNSYGAISGASIGFIYGLWFNIGVYIVNPLYPTLDVSIAGCNDSIPFNSSEILSTFTKLNNTHAYNVEGFSKFYSLSYGLVTFSGVVVTLVAGITVSLLTKGYKKHVDDSTVILNMFGFINRFKNRNKVSEVPLQDIKIQDKTF